MILDDSLARDGEALHGFGNSRFHRLKSSVSLVTTPETIKTP
jgi:hypothetical protein